MALLIDTAMVPARERLDFWLQSSSDAYLPVHIRSSGEGAVRRADVGLRASGPITLLPDRRRREHDDPHAAGDRGLRPGVPAPVGGPAWPARSRAGGQEQGSPGIGDVISYETSHPVICRADEPFESLVVRVPRHLLGRDAERISKLHRAEDPGRRRAAARGRRRFFRGLVAASRTGRSRRMTRRTPSSASSISSAACTPFPPAAASRSAAIARGDPARHQSFIEANLGDPDLDPEGIARASFISTRYLHKLFEAEGTSVCQWIRAARLERCRRDLLDPALSHLTILAIASRWGLPGPQHFSRLFRATYGCSPSEWRRRSPAL